MELKKEGKKEFKEKMFLGMIGASLMTLVIGFFEHGMDGIITASLVALFYLVVALYFKFKND